MSARHNRPLVRKLGAYVALSEPEIAVLEEYHRHRRPFAAGSDMLHQGQTAPSAYLLAEGWVISYKMLRRGSRQIVDFQIPGDFLGLRSVLFRTADHFVEPVTPITASEIPIRDLVDLFETCPRLGTAILWAASSDEAVVVERLVSLGRRDATERTGHFLLELGARLGLVGLAGSTGYACPLSQYHLADALGLSAVHVNRVLRQLREQGLLTFRDGRVRFDDRERLIALTDFDKAYLDFEGPMIGEDGAPAIPLS